MSPARYSIFLNVNKSHVKTKPYDSYKIAWPLLSEPDITYSDGNSINPVLNFRSGCAVSWYLRQHPQPHSPRAPLRCLNTRLTADL